MSEDEQRIAIATACGYEHMPNAAGLMWNHKENRAVITPGTEVHKARLRSKMRCEAGKETLPDYLHDLNAMHEAEKVLSEKQQVWYLTKLLQVRYQGGADHGMIGCMADRTVFATAEQRAEAFLRTIGKWQ